MTGLLLTVMLFIQAGLQPGTGIVTGRIQTPEGRPAAGIRVAAVAAGGSASESLLSIGQTDSAGKYSLSNIPEGSYYIVAGRLASLTYYPGGTEQAAAQTVSVEAARIVSNINFSVTSVSIPASTPVTASAFAKEVTDFVMIDGESNPARKLKLLQAFQKNFPRSRILAELFPMIMEIYVAQENTATARAYAEKVLLAGATNVTSLIRQSQAFASSDPVKAVQAGEQAVAAAERLKTRHPPAPYDGPAFDSWAGAFEGEARNNLIAVRK